MSYILDALKKSSEERRKLQEEEQQSPLPLNPPVKRQTHRQYRLLKVLLPVTIFVFSVAFWWFSSHPVISDKDASLQESALPTEMKQGQELTTTELTEPAATGSKEQGTNKQPVAGQEKGLKDQNISDKPLSPVAGTNPPLLEELPLSFQALIPEMKYSGHVFSPNPELRMIMINTTVVREGDLISPELRLKEITSDGLTMSHKGTDFRVELF